MIPSPWCLRRKCDLQLFDGRKIQAVRNTGLLPLDAKLGKSRVLILVPLKICMFQVWIYKLDVRNRRRDTSHVLLLPAVLEFVRHSIPASHLD